MKIKLSLVVIVVGIFFSFSGITRAASDLKSNDLEVILDFSGNMSQNVGEKSKAQITKDSLRTVFDAIPAGAYVGVRAYGFLYSASDKTNGCKDTELVSPIGSFDKAQLISKIDSLQPKGWAPLEYALKQTRTDFSTKPEYGKTVILVSGGSDNCGGDPCAAVKEMVAGGFGIKINAIGFGVDAKTETQLRCITDASGGEYRFVKNADEMKQQLEYFSNKILKDRENSSSKDEIEDKALDVLMSGNTQEVKEDVILPSNDAISEQGNEAKESDVSNQVNNEEGNGSLFALIGASIVLILALGGGVFWWIKIRNGGGEGEEEYSPIEMNLPPQRISAQKEIPEIPNVSKQGSDNFSQEIPKQDNISNPESSNSQNNIQ